MTRKKQGPPKRWRSKAAREIAAAAENAGGAVKLTGKGHLRITGPLGVAIVASDPDTGHQGGRALANTWATIERETGLQVAPTTGGKPAATERAPGEARPRPQRQGRQERRGEITRWNPGETYGFITSTQGHSWFVSRDSLADGLLELPEGTQVTFSGSPKPKISKPYPEALRVRITAERADPADAGPSIS